MERSASIHASSKALGSNIDRARARSTSPQPQMFIQDSITIDEKSLADEVAAVDIERGDSMEVLKEQVYQQVPDLKNEVIEDLRKSQVSPLGNEQANKYFK